MFARCGDDGSLAARGFFRLCVFHLGNTQTEVIISFHGSHDLSSYFDSGHEPEQSMAAMGSEAMSSAKTNGLRTKGSETADADENCPLSGDLPFYDSESSQSSYRQNAERVRAGNGLIVVAWIAAGRGPLQSLGHHEPQDWSRSGRVASSQLRSNASETCEHQPIKRMPITPLQTLSLRLGHE